MGAYVTRDELEKRLSEVTGRSRKPLNNTPEKGADE
jgi:hypothetical protein